MNTKLDINSGDDLSDLLDGRMGAANKPAPVLPASYKPVDFTEPCKKCGGSGQFRGWSGRSFGPCFACKGAGKKTFKTSSVDRARSRENAQAREAAKATSALEAFKAEHPKVWAWMDGSTFDFAVSLRLALGKYGSLTENQIAAAYRAIERLDTAKAAREAQIAAAPVADTAGVDRLMAAFDAARAYAASKAKGLTIRNPKITIGNMVISPGQGWFEECWLALREGRPGVRSSIFRQDRGRQVLRLARVLG